MDKLETLREQVLAADVNQIKSIVYSLIDYLVEKNEDKVDVKDGGPESTQQRDSEFTPELHTPIPEGVTTQVIDSDIPESTTPVIPAVPVDPTVPPVNNAPDANPVPTPHFGV